MRRLVQSIILGVALAVLASSAALAAPGDPTRLADVDTARTAQATDAELAAGSSSSRSDLADLGNFVIGIHLAPILSVFSELDAFFLPRLELGYNLPPWGRRLEVFFSVAYTAPGTDGNLPDSRLPNGGAFNYDVTQKELMLGLGLYLRFLELGSKWNGYVGLGPVLFLLETVAEGDAGGQPFGENTAQATRVGLYSALGGELVLGPGALFFEVGLTWSKLDNVITGDTSTGAIAPTLGYRFMF